MPASLVRKATEKPLASVRRTRAPSNPWPPSACRKTVPAAIHGVAPPVLL